MSTVTVGAILGLAVLDMLSPAVVGVTVYLLLTRPRGLPLLLAVYLGTVAVAYYALGILLMLGLGAVMPVIDPGVWAWAQGGIGVALFIGSWFIPRKGPAPTPAPESRVARSLTPGAMVLLALGTWVFEFYTAVPYFAAIGIMTSAGLEPSAWLLLLAAYVLIMILPGVVLYLTWVLLGERLHGRLERWQRKLRSDSRAALSWIVGIAGVLLFLDALPSQITVTIP